MVIEEMKKNRISEFEIWRKVGEGSFGTVVLARRHCAWYAMKIINKKRMDIGDAKRVCAEARALRNLYHPFIIRLRFAFQDVNNVYLGLDAMEGGDLRIALERHGSLSVNECALYAAEIVLALEHIHSSNYVFRDLKPSNILVDARGHIALGDFGLAKNLQLCPNHKARTFCGTPPYMAPEHFLSLDKEPLSKYGGYGTEVDWYSLGIVLTQCLTGKDKLLDEVFDTQDYDGMAESFRKGSYLKPLSQDTPAEAADLRNRLCCVAVSARLKGGPELHRHPFFHSIDWHTLHKKEHLAPLAISLRNHTGGINAYTLFHDHSEPNKVYRHNILSDRQNCVDGVLASELKDIDCVDFLSTNDSLIDDFDALNKKHIDHSIVKHFDYQIHQQNKNYFCTMLADPSCSSCDKSSAMKILPCNTDCIEQQQENTVETTTRIKHIDLESQPSRCVVSPNDEREVVYRSVEEKKSDGSMIEPTYFSNISPNSIGGGSTQLERSIILRNESPTLEHNREVGILASLPQETSLSTRNNTENQHSFIYPPAASPLTCPITCDVFVDPVICQDSHTYERAALLQHIREYGPYSPCTGKPIDQNVIFSNLAIRRLCVACSGSSGVAHRDDDDTSTVAADDDHHNHNTSYYSQTTTNIASSSAASLSCPPPSS